MQVRFFSRLVCARNSSVNQTGPFGFATRAKKFGRPEPRASCPGPCSSPCRTVRSVPRGAPGSDVRASPSHTAKRAPPRATRSLASPPSAQRRGQDPLLPAPTKSYPPRRAPAPARESQSARWRRSPTAEAGRACSAATQGSGCGDPRRSRVTSQAWRRRVAVGGGSLAGPCHQCHAEVAKPLPLIFELEARGEAAD